MAPLFLIISLIIVAIFLFDRTILSNPKYNKYFIVLGTLFFLLAVLFKDIKGIEFLKIPIIQWVSYKILVWIIVKFYGREPKDTFWSNDLSLMKDGILNAIFWFVAFIFPTVYFLSR
ncbi:hypothetical protein AB4865_05810 [Capnocytophaga sp. ARDL2]|uniref:hypothetical protein n=1 Tax=Capnocytophaga sp. ARDL2 TaxID=3238809 RepID=UPI0035576149